MKNPFLLTLILAATAASGATLNVPKDYASVAEAVLAASDGDTIEMSADVQEDEYINIDKDLTFTGEGERRQVVSYGFVAQNVDVRFERLAFATNGIRCIGGSVEIADVQFRDCRPALDLEDAFVQARGVAFVDPPWFTQCVRAFGCEGEIWYSGNTTWCPVDAPGLEVYHQSPGLYVDHDERPPTYSRKVTVFRTWSEIKRRFR